MTYATYAGSCQPNEALSLTRMFSAEAPLENALRSSGFGPGTSCTFSGAGSASNSVSTAPLTAHSANTHKMASRACTRALRSPFSKRTLSTPTQRRTIVTSLNGVRPVASQLAKPAVSTLAQQCRGMKTIDFAGTKETVYGKFCPDLFMLTDQDSALTGL